MINTRDWGLGKQLQELKAIASGQGSGWEGVQQGTDFLVTMSLKYYFILPMFMYYFGKHTMMWENLAVYQVKTTCLI